MRITIKCIEPRCQTRKEWTGEVDEAHLMVVALWFHTAHEGHQFEWWEDGVCILGPLTSPSS